MTDPTLTAAPPAAPESAWARAERILSGDVRPDDYLPVTAEVRRLTDRELDYGRARLKAHVGPDAEPTEGAVRRQLHQNLLRVHCPEQHVAYLEDEHGILVVMTGLDEIAEMLRRMPREWTSERVSIGYIEGEDAVYF
jgi:hypothetical protein